MSAEEIINFVPGDLVYKKSGYDRTKIGIVLRVETNSLNNTIVTVLSDKIRNWYAPGVMLI